MKKLILCLISIAFIANTLAVSANVMFCAQDISDSVIIELSSDASMPCHDNQTDNTEEHCSNSCFCPIFTNNLTFIDESSNLSSYSDAAALGLITHLVSRALPPIYRPPILLS